MIEVGDRIPDATVFVLEDGAPVAVRADAYVAGKRVLLFGVPGAFTRTCSARHLPGFVTHATALKEVGIDEVICLAVNDVFVLAAWANEHDPDGRVTMISDGSLNFTCATGLEADMRARGFGLRCRRFAMVLEDAVVERLYLEAAGEFGATSAENVLAEIG